MSIYALPDNPISSNSQEFHLTADQDYDKAVDFITSNTPFSKGQIKSFMAKGAVWLNKGKNHKRLRRSDKNIAKNTNIALYINHQVLESTCEPAQLIADEKDYSIWLKPNGMLCQGSKWGDHTTINRWVELNLKPQRPTFIVHRIDKATTGLVILAHTKKAAQLFSQMFHDKKIQKTYLAIVEGHWQNKKTIDSDIDGKKAVSHVEIESHHPDQNYSKVKVNIETGRKHQIRIHLAKEGFPIIGDRLHGKVIDKEDMQLLAYELAFTCPITQQEKIFTATQDSLLF